MQGTGTGTSGGGGGGRGGGRNNARQAELQRQLAAFQQVGGQQAAGMANSADLNALLRTATLGEVVNRQSAARDLQGKMMGWGTYQNAGKNLFTTKEPVLMIPEWARAFNGLLRDSQQQLAQAAQQVAAGNPAFRDFSLGIMGILPSTQRPGFYVNGIQSYYPDDRARITISSVRDNAGALDRNIPAYLLPGSTAARAANARGFAIGLAFVKNPQNQTGYLRVGSKGWRDALARYVLRTIPAGELDMQHLFGQGAVYGLGPIYHMHGINIQPQFDRRETARDPNAARFPVRFSLAPGAQLGQYVNNGQFMRNVQSHYDTFLKNPDQQRIGRYGAASLFLRHADKMNQVGTGLPGSYDNLEDFNNAVVDAFANNESMAGIARWGQGADQVNYADFINRRGLTANPLRDAQGNAVTRQQSQFEDAGQCNVWGSGPGVSQRASIGNEYGFRFYKGKRSHLSTRRGAQGVKIAPETYYCQNTPDYVINPDRRLYQAGGIRATPQQSLEQVLADYNQPGFSGEDLRAQYRDWAFNPEEYGTNPWFMLNPRSNRLGFSRAAPANYQANMSDEQARQFNATNLTQNEKSLRSRDLFQEAVNNGPLPIHAKTSYPTTGAALAEYQAVGQRALRNAEEGYARPAPLLAGGGAAQRAAR